MSSSQECKSGLGVEGESPVDSQYSSESSQVNSQYDSPEIVSTNQVINDSTASNKETRTQAIMVERKEPADVLTSDGGKEVVQARGMITDLSQQDTADESKDIIKTDDVLAEQPTPEMDDKTEFQLLHSDEDASQQENGHSTGETKTVDMKRQQSSRTVSILQLSIFLIMFFGN